MLALATAGVGCEQRQQRDRLEGLSARDTEQLLSATREQELRTALLNFGDLFTARVSSVASDITWSTTSRRVREGMLRWKLRAIPTMQRAVYNENARLGLLESWTLAVQMHDFFENVADAETYGDYHAMLLETSTDVLEHIEEIAREFVAEGQFDGARERVVAFAARYPIRRGFTTGLTEAAAAAQDAGFQLGIPVTGVAESANAIDRLRHVIAVFTEMVEFLPTYTRWQFELMMLDLDSIQTVQTWQNNMVRLSDSIESIAATANDLPTDVRTEVETLLAATDEPQRQLQATLGDMQQTLAKLDSTLESTGTLATKVDTATVQFREAAEAWQATAVAVDDMMDDVLALGDDAGGESDGRPFDITEYTAAAERVELAAGELRSLLDDLNSGATAAQLADTSRGVINLLTYRVLIMIGALIVGLVLYRVVTKKLVG
jgi:hypothetical protein